jgi:hypothetical protein
MRRPRPPGYATELTAPGVPEQATEGLGQAVAIAQRLPAVAGSELIEAARVLRRRDDHDGPGGRRGVRRRRADRVPVAAEAGRRGDADALDAELRELEEAEGLAPTA